MRGSAMQVDAFAHITAQALVPEQLAPYVRAVGGSTPVLCGQCVAYVLQGHAVLIAWPLNEQALNVEEAVRAMAEAVDAALALPGLRRITVLGPAAPPQAPASAASHADAYWAVPLPPPPLRQKLRSLLRRAEREAVVGVDTWREEHAELVERYLAERGLDPGTVHIFRSLPVYLAAAPDALLFSARSPDTDALLAFCVGDYSGLGVCFYMFAFRRPQGPPGASDLLLSALLREGEARGHTRCNLGLGVNHGIRFFKQKWGATPFLPCVETSWAISAAPETGGGFWASLRRALGGSG